MNWSRVRAIYRKDMRDALRDSRVLTALLMPLAFGLFYSMMFTDTQTIKVGIVSSDRTAAHRCHLKAGRVVGATDIRHRARCRSTGAAGPEREGRPRPGSPPRFRCRRQDRSQHPR